MWENSVFCQISQIQIRVACVEHFLEALKKHGITHLKGCTVLQWKILVTGTSSRRSLLRLPRAVIRWSAGLRWLGCLPLQFVLLWFRLIQFCVDLLGVHGLLLLGLFLCFPFGSLLRLWGDMKCSGWLALMCERVHVHSFITSQFLLKVSSGWELFTPSLLFLKQIFKASLGVHEPDNLLIGFCCLQVAAETN